MDRNRNNKKFTNMPIRLNNNPHAGNKPAPNRSINVTVPTPCDVIVNLFKYNGKHLVLHIYTVTFYPEVHSSRILEIFMRGTREYRFNGLYSFDGISSLVSLTKFADTEFLLPGRNGEQTVRIEYKKTIDMANHEGNIIDIISALDNITKFHQRSKFFIDKKKIFDPMEDSSYKIDKHGLEIHSGLTSSFKYFGSNFFLNLDMAHVVFYQAKPLLEVACNMYKEFYHKNVSVDQLPGPKDDFWRRFETIVKNVRLVTTHRERNGRIRGSSLSFNSAESSTFEESEGVKISVAEYFAKMYGRLKYPYLPLIIVRRKESTFYIPLEVVKIEQMQKFRSALSDDITTAVINIAATRPNSRFESINDKARQLGMLNNSTLKEFGVAFDGKMFNCKGVILPPPQIEFNDKAKNAKFINVSDGSWNLRDVCAKVGVKIVQWKVFFFYRNNEERRRLKEKIEKVINTGSGLNVAKNFGVDIQRKYIIEGLGNLNEFDKAAKAPFNFSVLPDKSSFFYERIKTLCETKDGVYTQCILAQNIEKLNLPTFMSNLSLKINTKLGGSNWRLKKPIFGDKRTCLIGIDINHPSVGNLESPSVACIVGSVDYHFGKYETVLLEQDRSQEIVTNLKAAIKALLKAHYASTKQKPERIIVFRDGVGDSMFDAVFNLEVNAIRESCQEIEAEYSPELNFIIAQKRHSIRFSSKNTNLIPGTVVDALNNSSFTKPCNTTVASTMAPIFDFYLSSHNAIKGTARCVRYITILNGSNFSSINLQTSIYHLCHLYMRATKSVSIVPPIYYAHLGAMRGQCYLCKNQETGIVFMRPVVKKMEKTLYYL